MTKHLTEEQIAICAEALENGSYQSLSHDIREHVAQCDECAEEILMVADIAYNHQLKIVPEVTKSDKTQKIIAWSASIAAAIALILLLFDLSDQATNENGELLTQEATTEQSTDNEASRTDEGDLDKVLPKEGDETTQSDNSETSRTSNKEQDHPSPDNQDLIVKNNQEGQANADEPDRDQALPSSGAPGERMPSSGVPPHLREKADTIRFLAHYEPNEALEKLVERYKGNLRNSDDVKVSTPLAVTSSKSSITIKWDNPNKKRLIIEVLNNEGNRIMETETTHEEYTLDNMTDGLYYWKLISENFELLFCGKIVIKTE